MSRVASDAEDDLDATAEVHMFDKEDGDVKVTRKEEASLKFPMLGQIGRFKFYWDDVRREVLGCSGRQRLAGVWFNQIVGVARVTYEDLGRPGRIFEQSDHKVAQAALQSVRKDGHLERRSAVLKMKPIRRVLRTRRGQP